MGAAEQGTSSVTSVTLNTNNQLLVTSTQRGLMNIYRTEPVFHEQFEEELSLKEIAQLGGESYSGSINQAQFSHLQKEILGSVTDHGACCLYNVATRQVVSHFNKHSGHVKGLSFSPLNKLLMCSVGLDR